MTRITALREAIEEIRRAEKKADPTHAWLYPVYVKQFEELIEIEEIKRELGS